MRIRLALIGPTRHAVLVFGVILIVTLVLVVPLLAVAAGADSRIDERSRRRVGR